MSNKCPKCDQESLSFEDENSNVLDKPYCFECSDFINEYKDEDNINPTYYRKGIETTDYIVSHSMGYLQGNIIKYITRYAYKNGQEDLAKSIWYCAKIFKEEYKNEDAFKILMKAMDEIVSKETYDEDLRKAQWYNDKLKEENNNES